MNKQLFSGIIVVLFLAGCTAKSDPVEDPPSKKTEQVAQDPPKPKEVTPLAKSDFRKVTIFVDGMTEKFSLV